ncbi:GNAT family N-acetyltransferase [Allorhizocola rhizosphaerae]|uniref:GNAT family N-acetyltransferase n=1 Tax=Allorhizocola rhizosphaerae TaxID=1872709 RepID=UPI000E3CC94C|nr:GNAT family N-acetyltransferase [Allorhizocola rhizosphaerae]
MTLLDRLERFYDAVPRERARVEEFGGLTLFVRDGPGYPYYARPRLGGPDPTPADVAAVRARQRELGVPEAFEWVHDLTPDLLPIARAQGLDVLEAPLLVLGEGLGELRPTAKRARILDPADPTYAGDLAVCRAISHLGFGAPGTAVGKAGPEALVISPIPDEEVSRAIVTAIAESTVEGPLATGQYQRVGEVAEIVGVATVPSARRKGLGAAVTATLAAHALDHGVTVVFLSAGSDDVARVYEGVGFKRVGTACIATGSAEV